MDFRTTPEGIADICEQVLNAIAKDNYKLWDMFHYVKAKDIPALIKLLGSVSTKSFGVKQPNIVYITYADLWQY